MACNYQPLPELAHDAAHAGDSQLQDARHDGANDGPSLDASPPFLSCMGLSANCGPNGNENCCASGTTIPGGTFYRSYDAATDGMYPSMSAPATVSSFVLDRYEVTVGRFRKFVEVSGGTKANPPTPGSGAHPNLPDSGWQFDWTINYLTSDFTALEAAVGSCPDATWTNTPGANENLPITCLSWFEAAAFCAWDGGYLPTEAEWNYAAAGGEQQRAYPWSPANNPGSTTIDCSYANYFINNPSGTFCGGATYYDAVGKRSPKGDGRWGQADLAGNGGEWLLDTGGTYPVPCVDCADLAGSDRITRGGTATLDASFARTGKRFPRSDTGGTRQDGVRCARLP